MIHPPTHQPHPSQCTEIPRNIYSVFKGKGHVRLMNTLLYKGGGGGGCSDMYCFCKECWVLINGANSSCFYLFQISFSI